MNRISPCVIIALLSVLEAPAPAQEVRFEGLSDSYRRAAATDAQAALETFLPRFQAAARDREGEPEAGPFLLWILEHAGLQTEAAEHALERLLTGPADDNVLVGAARRLPYLYATLGPDVVDAAVRRLSESDSARLQGEALHARALLQATEWGGRSAQRQRAAVEALQAAAARSGDPELQARAEALRPVARDLKIGTVAPEILGLDMEGEPFKLSDYRGKVVVLDFWGDW